MIVGSSGLKGGFVRVGEFLGLEEVSTRIVGIVGSSKGMGGLAQ